VAIIGFPIVSTGGLEGDYSPGRTRKLLQALGMEVIWTCFISSVRFLNISLSEREKKERKVKKNFSWRYITTSQQMFPLSFSLLPPSFPSSLSSPPPSLFFF
jgi:hypothetical protein